jgi:hypothetical protein
MLTWEKRNPDGLTDKMRKQRKREAIEERKRKRSAEPVPEAGPGKLGKHNRW